MSLVADSSFYVHSPEYQPARPVVVPVVQPAVEQAPEQSISDLHVSTRLEASPTGYFRSKHLIDRVMTAALMMLAVPVMLLVALAILVCDGRPIMFRQVRVGKRGREFRIWKFRTMRCGAEDRTGAVWSSQSDTRVTRLGRWLRCSHLDELPQFFNVLRGDMNLVGPRPERPEFVETLVKQVPGYMQRNEVRPGITGLAQLRLGYDESIAGIPQKLACDLEYICNASLLGDAALLSKTLPHIAVQLHQRWTSRRNSGTRLQSFSIEKRVSNHARRAGQLATSRSFVCKEDVA